VASPVALPAAAAMGGSGHARSRGSEGRRAVGRQAGVRVLGSETAGGAGAGAGAGRGFVLRGGREGEEGGKRGKRGGGGGEAREIGVFRAGGQFMVWRARCLVALSTQFFRGRYVILENLFQGRVSFYFLFICALPVNFLYSF
jgi:hypothetical protein